MKDNKTLDASAHRSYGPPFCPWSTPGRRGLGMGRWVVLALAFVLILFSLNTFAANLETFATLKVGERTYQNVTVTTKAKSFIIISHSGGIASIKVSELPVEVLQKLGYAPPPKPKKHLKEAALWAGVAVPKAETALINPIKAKLSQTWYRTAQAWSKTGLASRIQLFKQDRRVVIIAAAVLVAAYFFYSYCCMLICQKTGKNPGWMVFLPLLQAFPLLRAASMSAWWFIAFLVPVLNLFAYVIWCVKIVDARQKTMSLAILLLFPLTSWFAFLFLAFSDAAAAPEGKELTAEIMTPQAVLNT